MRALLALDMHQDSANPIAHAVAWAARMSATLDIVTASEMVWDGVELFGSPENAALSLEWERRCDALRKMLRRQLLEIPEPLRGEMKVLKGKAAPALIEAAIGYDLLIVATHGRQGIARLFAGSVAEQVVRSVSCPVLVTRMDGVAVTSDGPVTIVLPIDSQEPSIEGVKAARRMLGDHHDYIALYAMPDMQTLEEHPHGKWSRERLAIATTTAGIPKAPVVIRTCTGNAGGEIAQYAEDISAALIAMPTHSRTALGRLAYGSVAERVVRIAPCAVLIAR